MSTDTYITVINYEELHEQYHEIDDNYYIFFTSFITRLKCFNYYSIIEDLYNWNFIYEIIISCANYIFTIFLSIAILLYYISFII